MKAQLAGLLVLAGLLAACNNSSGGNNNGGGGNPPPSPAFTLTFSPEKATFNIPKGGSTDLTISTDIKWAEVQEVHVTITSNVEGLNFSNKYPVIKGNSSVTVTVTVTPSMTNPKPSFTVTATGYDKDNRPKGESPAPVIFQWLVQ